MNTTIIIEIVIGVVVLVGIALITVWSARRRRRDNLRARFGPEYDREVRTRGERDAERHLSEIAGRRDRLEIRELAPEACARYTRRWEGVQSEFVDRPGPALDEADRLITDVMRDRGYPVEDFGERAELIAADHPRVVEHYRAAHSVWHARRGPAGTPNTEQLRQAFVHYRALFEELVRGRQTDIETSSQEARNA